MKRASHAHPRAASRSRDRSTCRHGQSDATAPAEADRTAQNLAQLQADAEAIRLGMTSQQLIREALAVNHKRVSRKTRHGYEKRIEHFADYVESVHERNLYTARRKHVLLFLDHLEVKGGANPHEARFDCSWCRERGYPDGPSGCGWSPSTVKGALAAIRFLYHHFIYEDDLPDHDPSAGIPSPKVANEPQWSPSREEVEQLLNASGSPRDRLIAYWMFYAPSRRAPFSDARWSQIDLEAGTWDLVGKGDKADMFKLNEVLLPVLRDYRRWQLKEAQRNPKIAAALADERTAHVLLSRNGKRIHPQQLAKMLKWRAIRAGIALVPATSKHDSRNGMTSKVCPHSLRRAWARMALNHPKNPLPIDVVSEVLRHKDISTTRKHYAQTKPERAQKALREFTL